MIAKRIVQGEEVDAGNRKLAAVAIYRVKEGKIAEVRFVK